MSEQAKSFDLCSGAFICDSDWLTDIMWSVYGVSMVEIADSHETGRLAKHDWVFECEENCVAEAVRNVQEYQIV